MEPTTPVDPTALSLSRAIRRAEGGDYTNYSGDASTSAGAYQFNNGKIPLQKGQVPANFKSWAHEVGLDPNDFSPTNQDHVAYEKIKRDLDSGLTQSQIAAKWNSGLTHGWENHVGTTTINGTAIHYDTPGYVEKVKKYYLEDASNPQQPATNSGYNPQPFSNPSQPGQFDFSGAQAPETPQDESLGGKLHGRLQDAAGALTQAAGGAINPLSGILQTVGAGAGAINDTVGAGLELIPGVKQAEGLLGKGVQAAANTGVGQSVAKGVGDFSQAHPELSTDIGAAGNIASVLPVFKGAGLLKDAAGSAIAKASGKTALDSVIEDVAPNLTAKAAAKQVAKQGLKKAPITGKITPSFGSDVHDIAQTVADEVKGYGSLGTYAEKVNAVKSTISDLAEKLKQDVIQSGQDRIYSPNELRGVMNRIETPISLRGTPFEKQIGPLKQAVVKLAEKHGGKVSSLLDVRKEFDNLVERTWPNLYERESAPMLQAVKEMRNALTTFTEERLPSGFGLKEQLTKQSRLFRALENISPKAVKEIGTTSFDRFAGKHPVMSELLKGAAKSAATGVGAGAVMTHL